MRKRTRSSYHDNNTPSSSSNSNTPTPNKDENRRSSITYCPPQKKTRTSNTTVVEERALVKREKTKPEALSIEIQTRDLVDLHSSFDCATLLRLENECTTTTTTYIMLAPLGRYFTVDLQNSTVNPQPLTAKLFIDGKKVFSGIALKGDAIFTGVDVGGGRVRSFYFQKNEIKDEARLIRNIDIEKLGVIELQVYHIVGLTVSKSRPPNRDASMEPAPIEENEAKLKGVSVGAKEEICVHDDETFYTYRSKQHCYTFRIYYYDLMAFQLTMRQNGFSHENLSPFEQRYMGFFSEIESPGPSSPDPFNTSTESSNSSSTPHRKRRQYDSQPATPTVTTPTSVKKEVGIKRENIKREPHTTAITIKREPGRAIKSEHPTTSPAPIKRENQAAINPNKWTIQQVISFLVSIDSRFSMYAMEFTENDIDGEALLGLTDAMLKDLNITKTGHRSKILQAIKRLQPIFIE